MDGEEVWGSFKPGGGGYDMMNGCTAKPLGVMNLGTYLSFESEMAICRGGEVDGSE